jgi:TPR repeat protein
MLIRAELKIPGKWISRAALFRDAEAIKLSFLTGFDSYRFTPGSIAESIKWLMRAWDLNDDEARFVLAGCYMEGYGVSQNTLLAASMYLLAAARGHAGAQFNIGTCYAQGMGVPVDCRSALKWYRKAAEQGDIRAGRAIKRLVVKLGLQYGDNQRHGTNT